MIYRELCKSRVSLLGMGNMRLPLGKDGGVDIPEAERIIQYVYENGVNYFDTAYLYHDGHSEEVLGGALRRYPRESYYLADKFWYQSRTKGMSIQDFLEIQLGRLGTDYIDYYLIHNVNDTTIEDYIRIDQEEGMFAYLEEEKKRGRIRHLGFSCHANPENLKRFLDYYPHFEFVQIQCNYLDWTLQKAKEKYEILADRGLPVIVMESCRGGRLADLGEESNALLKSIRPDSSIAAWAYRYLQDLENVSVILSGMSTFNQAEDNIKTFSEHIPLRDEEKKALSKVVSDMAELIPCTACHYCHECPRELDIPSLISLYNESRIDLSSPMYRLMQLPEEKRPSACISCGKCKRACPQGIDIPAVMKDFAAKAEEYRENS